MTVHVSASDARLSLVNRAQLMTANVKEAVAFLRRPQAGRWLLHLSGLPVTARKKPLPGWRAYLVSLYQDHILEVTRRAEQPQWLRETWEQTETEPIPWPTQDPEVNLVKNLAARSLYAAGIDAGQVLIYAASTHRAKVASVVPDWPAESADVFLRLARESWQKKQAMHNQELLLLGADPEFALRRNDGGMALASDFLKIAGVVGCDTTRYREELAMHQHPVAELRPEPQADPEQLFAAIKAALNLARQKIPERGIEWLAGGMPFDGYPIGGHLHFSGLTPTFALRRKLDAYLALPLVLIEDGGCLRRRERYGFLGDVREKAYGFEYRTLPSWLVHPVLTRGILHLSHLVATHHDRLRAAPHVQPHLIRAYYRGEKDILASYVGEIWRELRALPGYRHYQVHLDRYFSFLLSRKTWTADQDLRIAWKLV